MEDYRVTQTGDEIQEILNQSPLDTASIAELEERISDVEGKIPSEASDENKLADKEYVDDGISETADELTALINGKANAADVYTKSETYNKDELDSMITTPDVQYVSVTATAQTTAVTDVLPATGAADTVYRVGSWDGTQYSIDSYSEYAWNGTAYVPLSVKNTGIATGSDFDNPTAAQRELLTTVGAVLDGCDAEPKAGSENLVKSGGVYDEIEQVGHEVADLGKDIALINDGELSFTLGSINTTTGVPESSNNRCYTPMINGPVHAIFNSSVNIAFRQYDENGNYQGTTNWLSGGEATSNATDKKVRIVARYTDNATIADASVFANLVKIETLYSRVTTLETTAVGLGEQINKLNVVRRIYDFEKGGLNTTTGVEESSDSRLRSGFILLDGLVSATCNNTIRVAVLFYDGLMDFLGYKNWHYSIDIAGEALAGTKYVRFLIKKYPTEDEILQTEIAGLVDNAVFRCKVDVFDVRTKLNDIFYRTLPIKAELGTINWQTGKDSTSNNRARTGFYLVPGTIVGAKSGYKFSIRCYNSYGTYITGSKNSLWYDGEEKPLAGIVENGTTYVKLILSVTDDSNISDLNALVENFYSHTTTEDAIGEIQDRLAVLETTEEVVNLTSPIGNSVIQAAKEHTFDDGTPSIIEWFLLEEPGTNRFFYSKDLKTKVYLFTFVGTSHYYQYGILANGDIIAVRLAASITGSQSDNNRVNPFVFKASERWAIQHEVDFGSSLKPCGWLENCGLKNLPDGTTIFGEYTRPVVATANVWKISGDPLNKSNWAVKKTFSPIGGDGENKYKHIHCIAYDHFTGVVYATTGDEDDYAQIWYSQDDGETWTQIPNNLGSQAYRLLTITFTKDYVYWGQDSPNPHRFLRAARTNTGIIDADTVEVFAALTPQDGNFASYGQAYLPEFDAVFLFDRQDNTSGTMATTMPLRIVELSTGTVKTIGYIDAVDAEHLQIGFRTRFSEFYPIGGVIRVGFGAETEVANRNKCCGNVYSDRVTGRVNNLTLHIGKNGESYTCRITTDFI